MQVRQGCIPQPGYLIKHWTEGVPIESTLWEQVERVARMPFIYKHVALMP